MLKDRVFLQNFILNNSLAALSVKDRDCNNSLAASNLKDSVFCNSLSRKIRLSARKDLGSIIKHWRVASIAFRNFRLWSKNRY